MNKQREYFKEQVSLDNWRLKYSVLAMSLHTMYLGCYSHSTKPVSTTVLPHVRCSVLHVTEMEKYMQRLRTCANNRVKTMIADSKIEYLPGQIRRAEPTKR